LESTIDTNLKRKEIIQNDKQEPLIIREEKKHNNSDVNNKE